MIALPLICPIGKSDTLITFSQENETPSVKQMSLNAHTNTVSGQMANLNVLTNPVSTNPDLPCLSY